MSYWAERLNETGSPYGTINRIMAGARAEGVSPRPYLVLLDTDTVFVGEPSFVRADAGVRPVDLKGSASSGAGDAFDAYWARMCGLAGIELARLPILTTTVDRVAIRASYNGGLTVVRRELGILRKTREVFLAAFAEDLRPRAGEELNILASTGAVGREASEWWGSSQAALSTAIWSTTSDVHTFDARYNIPLHLLTGPDRSWPLPAGGEPVLVHYHYLAEAPYQAQLLAALRRLGCSGDVLRWIADRLSLFAV